jgi:hypothetical protein
MSGHPDLEQRYRRVLRLLPGYYRATWEEDMGVGDRHGTGAGPARGVAP